ncbi:MAG: TonB-dependent receptor plug domain-containing protein, partial [Solirubrobacterales bacterium]
LEMTLSASLYDSRGQNLYFPEFDTPETNHGVAVGADDERARHLLANFSLGEFRLQVADVSREKGIPTGSFDTLFNDPGTRTWDEHTYVDLEWNHAAGPGLNLVARASYDRTYYRGDYIYDYPPVTTNKDIGRGDSLGFEAFATYTGFSRQTLTFGGELQWNFRQDQQNYDVDPPLTYLDIHDSSTRWGVWLEDEVRIARGLILNGGLRLDRFRSQTRWSPRVALIVSPGQTTDVKLIFGRSSRPPNEYELFYETVVPLEKPNPALLPETIDTYEAVVDQALTRDVRLSVSGFLSRIGGLISLVEDPVDGSVQYQNADTIDSRGAEVVLSGRWNSGVAARASYSYQNVRSLATSSRLTNSPQHLAKFNLTAPLVKDSLTAGLEVQYFSSRLTLQGNEAGGYTLANLSLLARPLTPRLELSATVYNLFGAKAAVLENVYERDLAEFEKSVDEASSADSLERIFDAVAIAAGFYRSDPRFYRSVMSMPNSNAADAALIARINRSRAGVWTEMVRTAAEDDH